MHEKGFFLENKSNSIRLINWSVCALSRTNIQHSPKLSAQTKQVDETSIQVHGVVSSV